jgi:hypothetical protein
MHWFGSTSSGQNQDTHTRVNTLDLDAFNFNRFTWWFHTHKANIIFIILLVTIVIVGVYLGQQLSNDRCTSDKAEIGMIFGINIILIGFTYMCVWPHTQWRTLPPHSSKFLGTTAIAHQQTHASHKIRMQTPSKYLNVAPISMVAPIPTSEPPIVQSVITPIPVATPKVEEEPPSWFSNFVNKINGPPEPITSEETEKQSWLDSFTEGLLSVEHKLFPNTPPTYYQI